MLDERYMGRREGAGRIKSVELWSKEAKAGIKKEEELVEKELVPNECVPGMTRQAGLHFEHGGCFSTATTLIYRSDVEE